MLAAFGFSVTGILLILFANSLRPLLVGMDTKKNQLSANFRAAYLLVAAAFILWGVVSAIGNNSLLAASVLVGDAFLLFGTLLLLEISLTGKDRRWVWIIGIGGFALLAARAYFFYPEPFIQDGILVFNSQRIVTFMLTAIFLLVWLPTNLNIANLIIRKYKLYDVRLVYDLLYATSILAAVIFVLSKKPVTLALSFAAIGVCFLILTVSNILIKQIGRKHG